MGVRKLKTQNTARARDTGRRGERVPLQQSHPEAKSFRDSASSVRSHNGPTTRERIVETAIHLFNAEGIQAVPMHRIAAEVGISPGNLAYHYRGKRDLLLAILPRVETQLRAALLPPVENISSQDAAAYQINLFRTLWRYRFFFNALTHLLTRDGELREQYMSFQREVIDSLCALLDRLIHSGSMRAVPPPNTTRLLAMNMWMLWLSWLRFEQINNPEAEAVENAAIYDGALHHFSLMQTYYGKEFGSRLLEELVGQLQLSARELAAAIAPSQS
jgi:AcrR family transcriptional regulator